MCFDINRSSARLMIWGGPSEHNHILVSIYSHRSTPTRLNMIKTGLGFYCAAINQLYYLKSKVVSENVTISRFVVFVMPALWCDNIEGKKRKFGQIWKWKCFHKWQQFIFGFHAGEQSQPFWAGKSFNLLFSLGLIYPTPHFMDKFRCFYVFLISCIPLHDVNKDLQFSY